MRRRRGGGSASSVHLSTASFGSRSSKHKLKARQVVNARCFCRKARVTAPGPFFPSMVHLVLGNTAEPAEDGKRYNWTFYVRGATEFLDSVTIKLHPTFKNPVRTCESAPFEFKSRGSLPANIAPVKLPEIPLSANRLRGWGTFAIAVLLKFKEGTTHRTSWELQFDHEDASGQLEVPSSVASALVPGAPPPASETADNAPPAPPPVPAETDAEDRDGAESHSDIYGVRGSLAGCESEEEAMPEDAKLEASEQPGPGPPPELLRDRSSDPPACTAFGICGTLCFHCFVQI